MSRRNRETLKKFFRAGSLPSQEDFGDLIDSTLNMNDEGFNKSPENGLEITTQARRSSLVSFFRDDTPASALWRMRLDERRRRKLEFWDLWPSEAPADTAGDDAAHAKSPATEPTLSLAPGGRVGINTTDPGRELDVRGYVRSAGREGVVPVRGADAEAGSAEEAAPVFADGSWHTITGPLDGCHMFEVVAGVGLKRTGRYALLHAIAVNTFHPSGFWFNVFRRKKRIRVTQGYYRSRADKLRLRWVQEGKSYVLQLKSNADYGTAPNGQKVRIGYHITALWSDADMSRSWDAPTT